MLTFLGTWRRSTVWERLDLAVAIVVVVVATSIIIMKCMDI